MPYAEVTRALEQEAQMHSTAAGSASPCRLSPRGATKAAPQPGRSAARYSVPPGKYRSSAQWLLATYLPVPHVGGFRDVSFPVQTSLLVSLRPIIGCVQLRCTRATGKCVSTCVHCDIDRLLCYDYQRFWKISRSPPPPQEIPESVRAGIRECCPNSAGRGRRTHSWLSVASVCSP